MIRAASQSSDRVWEAMTASRRREVPSGTVGGRIIAQAALREGLRPSAADRAAARSADAVRSPDTARSAEAARSPRVFDGDAQERLPRAA